MAIDIRATVTCSLGTLISGSISDDYIQGSGLVKTRGSVEISGTITPAIGTAVTFSYTKDGVVRSIPRKLRVMSSFADPFRRTTTVELGCKLTYLSDLKEPIDWTAFDDPQNAAYNETDSRIVTLPLYASSVMNKCLTELGITASSNPLTNKFSIAEFDFGAGYVPVLSDLLVSESYCGYLDTNEVLQVFNLDQDAGTGPVFTGSDIVDLGPIGVGQLPGEAVTVSYSTLKLKDPDSTNNSSDPWIYTVSRGAQQSIKVAGGTYTYIPETVTETQYEAGGDRRILKQTVTKTTIAAEAGGSYLEAVYAELGTFPVSPGAEITEVTTTTYEYNIGAITVQLPNGSWYYTSGEVQRTTTLIEESILRVIASFNLPWVVDSSAYAATTDTMVSRKTIQIDETVSGYTRSITNEYAIYGYTQEGQQLIALTGQNIDTLANLNGYVSSLLSTGALIFTNTSVNIQYGDSRLNNRLPPVEDINNAAYAKGGDPNNGWRTESVADLELALGSATAQRRIEFSMPYAPDDTFSGPSGGPFTATPSDAPAKAMRYGRVQNRLLLGNRNGVNLQLAPEKLPAAPYSPLYLQASGLTALYRANGTNWAFDSNGIVCSVDALFWAAVGGTGTFWFPVAPGITTLPVEPPIVDGEMNATTVVLPYNETAVYEAVVSLGNVVTKFDYSLSLLTVVPALALKTQVTVFSITKVTVPVASAITLSGQVPVIGEPVIESVIPTLYTGNGGTQTITGLPWSPSLVWIKQRNDIGNHFIFDVVRGAPKYLRPNLVAAEVAGSSLYLSSFNSDGFTMGGSSDINDINDTYVAWSFAALSSARTNTQGTITSTVRSSEFYSIADFTGNSTAGATVGHGLQATPTFVIVKIVAGATGWFCGGSLLAANTYMQLNSNSGTTSSTNHIRGVDSTTVTLGANGSVNATGSRALIYAFCDVPGLCKGGTYTGNGDEAGQAINVGFAPQFLLVKRRDGTGGWNLIDTARNLGTNQLLTLDAGGITQEITVPEFYQLNSTGFVAKRGTLNSLHDLNISSATYIYLAFGKVKPTVIAPLSQLGLAAELPSISAT